MKLILVYFVLLCVTFSNDSIQQNSNNYYWENLNQSKKELILKREDITKEVIQFYHGEFPISDNNKTFLLLDSLTSMKTQIEIISLYFYVFNKIVSSSDNSINEALGQYCGQMLINYPTYVFLYFEKNLSVRNAYANYLGYEMYFKDQGTSSIDYDINKFKNIINKKISAKTKSSSGYKEFFKMVELNMKKMNE